MSDQCDAFGELAPSESKPGHAEQGPWVVRVALQGRLEMVFGLVEPALGHEQLRELKPHSIGWILDKVDGPLQLGDRLRVIRFAPLDLEVRPAGVLGAQPFRDFETKAGIGEVPIGPENDTKGAPGLGGTGCPLTPARASSIPFTTGGMALPSSTEGGSRISPGQQNSW